MHKFLELNCPFMSNTEIDQRVWVGIAFVSAIQDRMHWRPYYAVILNKAIKDHLATDKNMQDSIKKLIDVLSDNVKNITVDLKYRTHTGDTVKIKGVYIKTKACHLPIIVYTLSKFSGNIFGGICRIITKNHEKTHG